MTKKIGCVIAYRKNHTNYGTSLQGYAMLHKLQQLGYNVEVINYIKRLGFSEKIRIGINQLRVEGFGGYFKKRTANNAMKENPSYAKGVKTRIDSVEAYKAKKLLPLFHDYVGYQAIHEGSKNYDAVVVGSDQVWLPHGLETRFFNLRFVDDSVRKVSYASSFGVSEIPNFQKEATGAYLDRFYKIGVREVRGKEIVEELSHRKAQVVADPTLLLSPEEWKDEIKDTPSRETEPYIFCYFLGNNPDARKAVNELKEKTGCKIVTLRHMDEYVASDEQFGDEAPYDVDPNDFIKYISEATYVCTDSFHCSVFSSIFHRQFMNFYRFAVGSKGGRNSRIDSLFSVLGISREHIYQGDVMKIQEPIDWDIVDTRRESLREESINYIEEAFK